MVDTIVDQYPMETASFDILPQESPVSYLDYGGTLTQIGEHVRQKRKENRVQRRDYLIKEINNVNLGILVDKIKMEAEDLSSYRAKQWLKGPSSKANYKKFFKSHDISLKYLEDMFIVQSKGKPIVELNTLIKIKKDRYTNTEYGAVVKQIGKDIVEYVSLDKDMLPAAAEFSHNYYRDHNKMNVWKCEVVGEFSPDNWDAYTRVIDDYNRDMKCRKEFWDNHPVLSYANRPYDYYNMRIDVMNGELPTHIWYVEKRIWNMIKGYIDEDIRKREVYAKIKKEADQKCSDWMNK